MSSSRHTILLVEDNPDDVLNCKRVLNKTNLGKPVQVVSRGEEAIAYLNGQGEYGERRAFPIPSLIFLDLKLPGLSGFEVLTWIRQQTRFHRIQVVVLTGSRHTIDIYRAYELGANSFLVKPVRLEGLSGLTKTLNLGWLVIKELQKVASATDTPSAL